ncbi:MAG: hypothetical protein JXA41_05925 [Deltaproteobacteria bacterium]|nr:hypothetical protein [Deltaproteobacteria bacterium]
MKRVLVFFCAMVLFLCMASPGFATISLTKSLSMGIHFYAAHYYYHGDKELRAKGVTVGQPTLYENAGKWEDYINSTSVFIMHWRKENYGILCVTHIDVETEDVEDEKLGVPIVYGYWNISPKLSLRAGKGTSLFSEIQPHAALGGGEGKATGIAYGNYFTGYHVYARVHYKVGKHGEIKAGVVDPRATEGVYMYQVKYSPYVPHAVGFKSNGGTIDNATTIPKFELAYWHNIPLKNGRAQIQTSAFWQEQKFDNVAGPDNKIESYGLGLGLDGDFGPVLIMAELTYGQNWLFTKGYGWPISPSLSGSLVHLLYGPKCNSTGHLQNAEHWAGFIEARYRIGKYQPSIIFGRQTSERNVDGKKDKVALMEYGVRCPIRVHKHLEIRPEIMVFDNGTVTMAGVEKDYGKEWVAGAVFAFLF